jgi:ligand-binding sensor protein
MLQIDKNKLSELLKNFNKLTGIKICVFDESGKEIACEPKNYCDFCQYVRSSAAGAAKCEECDKNGFDICKRTKEPYRYTCHMGLTECVAPLLHRGECVGYLMIGQTSGSRPRDGLLLQKADEYSLSYDKLKNYCSLIEFSEDEKISAAISIMEACAGYLYLNNYVHGVDSIGTKIDNYIVSNLRSDLSVNSLCSALKLSRVNLYSSVSNAFGTTPAEYIKRCRLDEACRLLRVTDMKITEIADRVGISDYNYFSKLFKKTYNVSPREYRKDS